MNRRSFLSFLGLAPLAVLPALPALPKRREPAALTDAEREAFAQIALLARYLVPDRRGWRHDLIEGESPFTRERFHDALDAIGTPRTPPQPI